MNDQTYGLQETPPPGVNALASLQWLMFMVANVIALPVLLAHALKLSPAAAAALTNRTFIACGLISILQALFGHRYTIVEGPAGMWFGVAISLIEVGRQAGFSTSQIGSQLELGLIIASLVFILLALTGALGYVRRLFTAPVTATFLVVLTIQLSASFLDNILGIGFEGHQHVQPLVAVACLVIMAVTVLLMVRGSGWLQNFAVLTGLALGWVGFALLGLVQWPGSWQVGVQLPQLFPFGRPSWNCGVVITTVITAVVLLSNVVASIQAYAEASGEEPGDRAFNGGALFSGLGTALMGAFGVLGTVPLVTSSGLVALTGVLSRMPFIIGSLILCALGFFPGVGELVSSLPAPVGSAILLVVFCRLFGTGLRDIKSMLLDQRDLFVLGLAIVPGAGLLFVPAADWSGVPAVVHYLLGNGLIVAVLLSLVLEHLAFPRQAAGSASRPAEEKDSPA